MTNFTLIFPLAYTGFRKGEAFDLQWKNIDFKDHTITVERTRDNKGVRTPKTKRSYRTIYIDNILVKQLKEYKTWCKKTKLSYGLHEKKAILFLYPIKQDKL
ncbi:tyrosine-type recombinase/integrase [Bacillus sp. J14TS2]|uniref:tyrosine-type recombinase/integrase n=1 Tax=Bacillus sp. J14TS2 TaxID=2807188 RepID=UPI002467E871|nr:tyrosine-type recombinase/integrase [Bacillus sp. J14TS2]